MVFAVLFGITIGCTAICGMRMMLLTSCASSVASACEMIEDPHHQLVVLRVLRRLIRDDDDRPLVQ